MAVIEHRDDDLLVSPLPWMDDAEFTDLVRRTVDGDGEALSLLFRGYRCTEVERPA